ncbi:MAG: hypothetical protein IPO27_14100 [Bacteroidetes bacterium]|nr:hypothetical protein [Bacteroidota bacterium]
MIKELLIIRCIQLWREFLQLNYLYRLLVIVVPVVLIYFISGRMAAPNHTALIGSGVLLLLLLSIHLNRKDAKFIYSIVNQPWRAHFAEYILPLCLFVIIQLALGKWIAAFTLIAGALLIALIPGQKHIHAKTNFKPFVRLPLMYEWWFGLRQRGLLFYVFIFLQVCLSYFPYVSLAFSFVLFSVVFSFYSNNEPASFIISFNQSSMRFLSGKIYKGLLYMSLTLLPGLLLYTIFNFNDWYIVLAFYFLCVMALAAIITLKYARYAPNEDTGSSSILQTLILMSIVMPWFLPLPLFILVFYFSKAIKNLSYYLHDFN